MRVYECKVNGERGLVGVSRKYLKIVRDKEVVELDKIGAAEIQKDSLLITLEDKTSLVVSGLERADLEIVQETIKGKRMISKEEITEAVKKNIQLQKTYKNINQSEHKIFYKIFGELLLKTVKKEESTKIEQTSSSGRAKFVISNKITLSAYFNMNISFLSFVNYFYSGYLMMGSEENEVDTEIFRILNRPVSSIERVNVRSMILQDTAEETEEIKQKPKTIKKEHLINPELVRLLNEKFLNSKNIKNTPEAAKKIERPVLHPPVIRVETVLPLRRIGVPMDILRRMKEVSKLIYKNKNLSEEIKAVSNNLQQSLKDEIRRKLPIEEGNAVMMAIDRIIPTRFIRELNNQSSNK
ncbi:hypothetical protein NEMIN01_0403 [Nematocida minor]|uniref:uncharacterized protein n=1 Tax=Nematocida minor TaxID=1912983 RepID=UPI00221EF805|nr:uncharacterized protein NEMIN01_0403 [Nematocida minor]KAI5189237.1 hypothetical protein NEMIN01_0403 [Nematocida minor]